MYNYHYTYITSDGQRYYIGVRSTNKSPYNDKYMGSFSDKTFKPTKKWILRLFSSRKAAIDHEIWLHNHHDVGKNPLFANRAKQTSTRFNYNCTGRKVIHSEETKRKIGVAGKGRIPPNKGKKMSSEFCKKVSEAKIDKTLYHCIHKDGTEHICTTYWLRNEYNLYASNLKRVRDGKNYQCKGWRVACLL